jgi:DNA-binding transcriptional ArsR family regulator
MEKFHCNILELEARRSIYNFILNFPGLHIREISRRLKVPFTTLQYHLRYLEKRELVRAREDGKYTRYYITSRFGRKEKDILNLLHKKTPVQIIFYLLTMIVCSQVELSKSLDKHPTTIEFHLKKMEKMGIISQVKSEFGVIKLDFKPYEVEHFQEGNEIIYRLEDPYLIYDLLITYNKSLFNDEIYRQMVDYIDYMVSTGVPNKMASPRDAIDAVFNFFWDMFPPPFTA